MTVCVCMCAGVASARVGSTSGNLPLLSTGMGPGSAGVRAGAATAAADAGQGWDPGGAMSQESCRVAGSS